jgi:glycosyltransferase involved in cell wall biosynthesis
MTRQSVLYVTPLMPRPGGNGLAMRACAILRALARRFDVHLFVVPVAGDGGAPCDVVRALTVRIGVLDLRKFIDPLFALIARIRDPRERAQAEVAYPKPFLSRFCTGDSATFLADWAADASIQAVHVMRLYLAPIAERFLLGPGTDRLMSVLDLDDDEVRTNERLARLHRSEPESYAARAEAAKYCTLSDRYFRSFHTVTVCSEGDRARLAADHPNAHFDIVPNSISAGGGERPIYRAAIEPPRLLFVGNFGYFPNLDAAEFLCREVLPGLRQMAHHPVATDLVGAGSDAAMANLSTDPSVTVQGFVEDLGQFYARANIAVVPLRAGGGTRIKLLEAFAHGVPVVATRVGAEGIDVIDKRHLLLADTAEDFARACLATLRQPLAAAQRAEHAAKLVAACYSRCQISAAIDRIYARIGSY